MIVGVDEVGRGCLAGPLVAAAVLLPEPCRIIGLKDSKMLTRAQREALDIKIRKRAKAIGIGWVEAAELDEIGMTAAVGLAMRRAVEQIAETYDRIIIDGNYNFLPDYSAAETLIRADQLIPAVSAASIIAKVARDRFMIDIAGKYPGYGFEQHVGYSTAAHIANIARHGVCALHRRSFRPVQLALADLPEA